MSSSSDSSSTASSSPPASPEASVHDDLPSLERIVLYFVAAKKSLASISNAQRAGELVADSRHLIEDIAVLNARNTFARAGVDGQLDTLYAIQDSIKDVRGGVTAEFNDTLKTLDAAHIRLEQTLTALRNTVVDRSLQRSDDTLAESEGDELYQDDEEAAADPNRKSTLFHFIDENGHATIVDALHRLLDEYHEADTDFQDDIARLDDTIRQITTTLQTSIMSENKPTIYDDPNPSIPDLFHTMESHALEMAHLLTSLTNHYDLCVTALKHTEGGGEAAKLALQQADDLNTKNAPEESLFAQTIPEPISPAHRKEMLRVLCSDAAELDDVTTEIRDFCTTISDQHSTLLNLAHTSRATASSLRAVLFHLHQTSTALPLHNRHALHFRDEMWSSISSSIAHHSTSLSDLTEFYAEFSTSYAKVLAEKARRQQAAEQQAQLARRVGRELERLYESDREKRREFMERVGGLLPRDLWPGVGEGGVRWVVRGVEGEEGE